MKPDFTVQELRFLNQLSEDFVDINSLDLSIDSYETIIIRNILKKLDIFLKEDKLWAEDHNLILRRKS